MRITVSITNKSFWVHTWKMLSDYAKRSTNTSTKTAKTNPDGTVSAEIDRVLLPELIAEIESLNIKNKGMNTLNVIVNTEDTSDFRQRA